MSIRKQGLGRGQSLTNALDCYQLQPHAILIHNAHCLVWFGREAWRDQDKYNCQFRTKSATTIIILFLATNKFALNMYCKAMNNRKECNIALWTDLHVLMNQIQTKSQT